MNLNKNNNSILKFFYNPVHATKIFMITVKIYSVNLVEYNVKDAIKIKIIALNVYLMQLEDFLILLVNVTKGMEI